MGRLNLCLEALNILIREMHFERVDFERHDGGREERGETPRAPLLRPATHRTDVGGTLLATNSRHGQLGTFKST